MFFSVVLQIELVAGVYVLVYTVTEDIIVWLSDRHMALLRGSAAAR